MQFLTKQNAKNFINKHDLTSSLTKLDKKFLSKFES